MSHIHYLIVGSGLFGSTFAYRAKQAGKKCVVIDKRPYLGGNLYCENIVGINVHKYGAHIFHTSNRQVWDFVKNIVEFNRYTNSPIANYRGEYFNLPFNMNTFYQMWKVTTPDEAQYIINDQRQEIQCKLKQEGIEKPRNLEEQALCLVGRDIYEKLIKGYTEKQWGRKCTQLPAFIIKRLPLRFVYDNNYFNDLYQGIPIGGYNKLIDGLLRGIETYTDTDYFHEINKDGNSPYSILGHQFEKIVYSGPIDQFYDYRYGHLNYRTVTFETEVIDTPNYQGNAVVNYTDISIPFTRIIEHKHFEKFGNDVYLNPQTVISKEYSTEWEEGLEPYYPINDNTNNSIAEKYRQLAVKEDRIIFGGRLAEYRYYDMAPIIEKVLSLDI